MTKGSDEGRNYISTREHRKVPWSVKNVHVWSLQERGAFTWKVRRIEAAEYLFFRMDEKGKTQPANMVCLEKPVDPLD